MKRLAVIAAFGFVLVGCGNTTTQTAPPTVSSHPPPTPAPSNTEPSNSSDESSAPKPIDEEVSPACKEARETAKLEESNPESNPTYAREDREVAAEECDAAARAHWAEVKHRATPEGQAEIQSELHSPKGEAEMHKLAEQAAREGY